MTQSLTKPILVDRRFVLGGTAALAGVATLAPFDAEAQGKGAEPTGQTETLEMGDNNAVDVSVLNPGELVVVSSAGTFYGILRRTPEQIAAAQVTEAERQPVADSDRVINSDYLVLDLACTHRGCQVGYSNEVEAPFACPCHRASFDSSGRTLSGPARENLWVPAYEISGTVVTFTS